METKQKENHSFVKGVQELTSTLLKMCMCWNAIQISEFSLITSSDLFHFAYNVYGVFLQNRD